MTVSNARPFAPRSEMRPSRSCVTVTVFGRQVDSAIARFERLAFGRPASLRKVRGSLDSTLTPAHGRLYGWLYVTAVALRWDDDLVNHSSAAAAGTHRFALKEQECEAYSTRFTRFFISSLLLAACVFLRSPSSREDCSLAKVYTFARLRMSVLIKLFSGLTRCTLSGYAAFAILTGCGVGALQSSYIPARSATQLESRPMRSNASAGYVYVSNRTQQGTSELLVYPAAAQNPSPLRIVTKKLVDATGIAVDLSGDVYVANGSGGNVVEFAWAVLLLSRRTRRGSSIPPPSPSLTARSTLQTSPGKLLNTRSEMPSR